jgi:hypothetical protein
MFDVTAISTLFLILYYESSLFRKPQHKGSDYISLGKCFASSTDYSGNSPIFLCIYFHTNR